MDSVCGLSPNALRGPLNVAGHRPLPKLCKLVFLFKTPDTFDQHHQFIFASLFVASDAALPLMVVISSSILKSGLSKQEQNDRRQLFLGGQ